MYFITIKKCFLIHHIFRHCWNPQYSVSVVPEVQSGDPWESPGPFQGTSKVMPFFYKTKELLVCAFSLIILQVYCCVSHRLHDVKDQVAYYFRFVGTGLSQLPNSATVEKQSYTICKQMGVARLQ